MPAPDAFLLHTDGGMSEDAAEVLQGGRRARRQREGRGADRVGLPSASVRATEPARFPDGFTWGTATAAHQIEGGNWNNDWWRWEHIEASPVRRAKRGCLRQLEPLGGGCRLGGLPRADNYRFSIEWSRIEPEDGEISIASLERYRRQCEGLRDRGVDPVVTFHHFTTPRWLADRGGVGPPEIVERFGRFCEVAAGARGGRGAGMHDQRAEHRGANGLAARALPAGRARPGRVERGGRQSHRCPPGRGGRDSGRAASGVPVGLPSP